MHRFVKIALYRSESPPSENLQRRLVLWVILCLTAPDAVSRLLHRSDLDAHHENLLEVAGLRLSERIEEVPDLLPLTDLPLLVAAANLIQLVGAPGRPDSPQPDLE